MRSLFLFKRKETTEKMGILEINREIAEEVFNDQDAKFVFDQMDLLKQRIDENQSHVKNLRENAQINVEELMLIHSSLVKMVDKLSILEKEYFETQTPLEHVNEPDHGSFPWNEGITKDFYADERREFREWLFEYGVEDNIVALLHVQGFLTEGDMSLILRFESSLNNPFHFFCGHRDAYTSVMNALLIDAREQIENFDFEKDDPRILELNLNRIQRIREALDDHLLPEVKNDKD